MLICTKWIKTQRGGGIKVCLRYIFHMRKHGTHVHAGHANTKPTTLFMRALVTAAIVKLNTVKKQHIRVQLHRSVCGIRDREVSGEIISLLCSHESSHNRTPIRF